MYSTYFTVRKAQYSDETVLAKDELKRGNLLLKMYSNLKLLKLNANVRSTLRKNKTPNMTNYHTNTNTNTAMKNNYSLQQHSQYCNKNNQSHQNIMYNAGNMSDIEMELVLQTENTFQMAPESQNNNMCNNDKHILQLKEEETQEIQSNDTSKMKQQQQEQQEIGIAEIVSGGMYDTNHSYIGSMEKDMTTESTQHSSTLKEQFSKDEIIFNEQGYQELHVLYSLFFRIASVFCRHMRTSKQTKYF